MIRMTVERIQRESPDTKLYLQSLLPFDESFGRYKKLTGKTDMVPEINAQLEVLAKDHKITFINLFPLFTEKGTNVLRKELTSDGLHLNEEGYKIWVKALKRRCRLPYKHKRLPINEQPLYLFYKEPLLYCL